MTALVRILSYVSVSGLSKMADYNGKCLRNNVYLNCIHDSNEIPTAIPILSRSCIMTALVQILSYVRVSSISKIVAYNRKCLPVTGRHL